MVRILAIMIGLAMLIGAPVVIFLMIAMERMNPILLGIRG